jgi:hypothetical protein
MDQVPTDVRQDPLHQGRQAHDQCPKSIRQPEDVHAHTHTHPHAHTPAAARTRSRSGVCCCNHRSSRHPQIQLSRTVAKMGSRGRANIGSLLHSLTPSAIQHGFASAHVTPRTLQLFSMITADAAEYLEHTSAHSYLSHSSQAAFFRRLAGACPEIIDVLCTVNAACIADINALRRGLAFLSSAVGHMAEADTPGLHTAIRECDLGPLACYLATKACEEARRDFGTMFALLVEDFVPADFEFVSLQAAAVLQVIRP